MLYKYARYDKNSFIILISAHYFSLLMEELIIFIKLSINSYHKQCPILSQLKMHLNI